MRLRLTRSEYFWCFSSLPTVLGAAAHSLGAHFLADGARVFPAPPRVTHRIASRVGFHQFIQECHHVVFFKGRTTASHCADTLGRKVPRLQLSTPKAIVFTLTPVSRDSVASPPCPSLIDSSPK